MKNKNCFNVGRKRVLTMMIVAFLMVTLPGYAYSDTSIVKEVRQALMDFYVNRLPDSILNKQNVGDMIKEINKFDPYTKYYTASKFNEFIDTINYNTSLLGVYIKMVQEGAKVESIMKNSPEGNAGLQVGDVIVLADNHILVDVKQEIAIKYILGEIGKPVKLRVKRGESYLDISVSRVEKKNSTVEGQMLDKHIGYFKISSFGEDSSYLFEAKLNQYKQLGADSYIIDIRYNNGGFFTSALDIAGFFIGNSPAVITKGRIAEKKTYYGTFHGQLIDRPVIFLINGHSASSAEILAAAVKDYKKATFIGSKTYGKGSIQWSKKLSNNDVLKMTIEKFYSPKGKQIANEGIKPDLALSDDVDSLRVAQLLLSTNNYLKDTRGNVKIHFNNRTVVVNLDRATTPVFWKTYRQLLELAYNNGSVLKGNGLGWTALKKSDIKDYARMYYPDYKKTVKLDNVNVDSQFTLNFGAEITKENLASNIELIETGSGMRVPVKCKLINDNKVVVSPVGDLMYEKTYYLIVHPILLKSVKNSISSGNTSGTGSGMLNEIRTKGSKFSAANTSKTSNN